MAQRALPTRSLRWRRRRGATILRGPRPNASPLRIQATTAIATIGRICAPRNRIGRANGATARLATVKRGGANPTRDAKPLAADIGNAVKGVERNQPTPVDTLCCGTLGGIEFFCEAGAALNRDDLRALASQRLMTVLQRAAATGDYRWNSGKRQFNLGLFRGLSGVGYTLLRQIDASLPNVLIWE